MSGRPVPWASWDEWRTLRDDLWSIDPKRQENGLHQVSAWRLRGKLPLGVDTTAHLMDARRADQEWQRGVAWSNANAVAAPTGAIATAATNATTQPHEASATAVAAAAAAAVADAAVAAGELPLRLRYSLPLIRLVNGISDSQQRGRVASSVAVLSDAAGLPRALVDVRHEATHNELPSLPLLRAAADSALAWLREYYWDGQTRALCVAAERIGALLACLADSWRAAVAAGMSRNGLLTDAEEEEEHGNEEEEAEPEGEATAGVGGYSGPRGQRLRRQTMSELRSLVPPAFAHDLLQPVLDCPVLLPPELPWHQHQQQEQRPMDRRQQQMEQGRLPQMEVAAWSAAMTHLLKWYPRLRLLLLQAALRRVVSIVSLLQRPPPQAPARPAAPNLLEALAGDPTEASPERCRQRAYAYVRWVLRLLPAGAVQQPVQAGPQPVRYDSPARKHPKKGLAAAAAAQGTDGSGATPSLDGPLTRSQLGVLLAIATEVLGSQDGCSSDGCDGGDVAAVAAEVQLEKSCSQTPASNRTAAQAAQGAAGQAAPSSPRRGASGAHRAAATGAEALLASAVGPEAGWLKEVVAALRRALALAIGEGRESKRHRLVGHAGEAGPGWAGVRGSKGAGAVGAGSSDTPGSEDAEEDGGGGGQRDGGEGEAEEGLHHATEELLQTEQQQQQQQQEEEEEQKQLQQQQKQKHQQQQEQQEQKQLPGGRRRRWQLCEQWSRCAIGCMPCPLNPNGRLSVLVPPPPVPPGGAKAAEEEVRAAGAWAAAASGNAARGPWDSLQPRLTEDVEVEYYVEPEEAKSAIGDVAGWEGVAAGVPLGDVQEGEEEGEEEGALHGAGRVTAGGGSGIGEGLFGALLQQQGAEPEGPARVVRFLL